MHKPRLQKTNRNYEERKGRDKRVLVRPNKEEANQRSKEGTRSLRVDNDGELCSSRLTRLNTSAAGEKRKIEPPDGVRDLFVTMDLLTLMWTVQRMSSDWAALNRGTFQFPTRQTASELHRHVTRVRYYASGATTGSRWISDAFHDEQRSTVCHLLQHRELSDRRERCRIWNFGDSGDPENLEIWEMELELESR